jgi:hypothetical protein
MLKATSSPITQKATIMKKIGIRHLCFKPAGGFVPTAELIDCGVSRIVGKLTIADSPLDPQQIWLTPRLQTFCVTRVTRK